MIEPEIVIIAYRPKPGHERDLLKLTREHIPLLREEGLATMRDPITCRAADGTLIEVFEWAPGGSARAHTNPRVIALWARYARVCDYVPLTSIGETAQLFSSFSPVDLESRPRL